MSYPGLGFDPASGDADAVADLARGYTAAADALVEADFAVSRSRELVSGWTGEAAEGFADHLRRLAPGREVELRRAATVLSGWARTIAVNRSTADRLDRDATALRRRIADTTDDVDRWRDEVDFTRSPHAAAQHAAAEAALTDLRDRLEAVLREARTLATDHEHAANTVADELDSLRGNPNEAPVPMKTIADLLHRMSTTTAAMATLVTAPTTPTPRPSAMAAFTAALAAPPRTGATITIPELPR
ncbi:uncharacterized protein YukE [Actinokineospora baliensis]|uniref:hypothetical protein n=1 Tax=Actinokineospora baliensis TaxID=547056 RepID=UPI00195D6441|nr:hypothetical protein [Actinokineospora baliensis]MBM7770592.1 uncharacterized protein YukE [Actinokineospora baliensis]